MRKESLLDEVFTAISSILSSQINLARLLELLSGLLLMPDRELLDAIGLFSFTELPVLEIHIL